MNKKDLMDEINSLGEKIEAASKEESVETLRNLISECKKMISEINNEYVQGTLYYFMGNAWAYIMQQHYNVGEFPLESEELEHQIKCHRTAKSLIELSNKGGDSFMLCQILTNLGNLFSHIGRFAEAQEYFNLCLDINDEFGMAVGNKGFALYYYARVVFEPSQQYFFFKEAREYLSKSISLPDTYPEAKAHFKSIIQIIDKACDSFDEDEAYNNISSVQFKLNKEERQYYCWCSSHRLFINPLNDLNGVGEVLDDNLFFPTIDPKSEQMLIFVFNQLKQEFSSARYLYYEGVNYAKPHFSDKRVFLTELSCMPIYSLGLEKVKVAFRMCYSIFDKIAYFLNYYLNLNHNPNKTTFRNVWYKGLQKDKGILTSLSITRNWSMRGLYWLSKDLYEPTFEAVIEPEAKEIATIRNYIEHKGFVVVDHLENQYAVKSDIFSIDRSYFYDKTLKLLKLSRCAIMYLAFLVYDEECLRTKEEGRNYLRIFPFNEIAYEFKQ